MNQLSKYLTLSPTEMNRRRFLKQAGLGVFVTGINASFPLPAWAMDDLEFLSNDQHDRVFDLEYRYTPIEIDGKKDTATAINGTVPAPLLRWKEGDRIRLNVKNNIFHYNFSHFYFR